MIEDKKTTETTEEELDKKPVDDFASITGSKELQSVIKALPMMMALYPIFAKALKGLYDALVMQGFTSEQALEIIKTRGLKLI